VARGDGASFGYSVSSSNGKHSTFEYALIKRGHEVNGAWDGRRSSRAFGRLQDAVEKSGREVLWFATGDHEYVIRDTATVARAHEILQPISALGAEQGKLGSMQGDLGRRQGELGQLQGEAASLNAQLAGLQARDDPRHRAELDELRQQLAALMQQVRGLGERQRELGEQQRRASLMAFDQLRSLADKAIASGQAQVLDSD